MTDFVALGVAQDLSDALATRGITEPTPIQAATLADSLAGHDVLGRGRTGSGKTFAFLLPLVQRLMASRARRSPNRPRALVLAPTRELATQIEESLLTLEKTAGLVSLTIFGGVGQNPQVKALNKGVDVLIACPGRLLDLMGQGFVDLSSVETTVLDEADHMADMGFLPMVKRILDKVPANCQKMLFSATLDGDINVLVKRYLHDPVVHEADSAQSPVATMDHHVLEVGKDDKTDVLADLAAAPGRTILFTRTKHGAKKLAKQLVARGVPAVDLHGNLAQNARTRNLDAFHSGRVGTLVATDIAARGIHVDDVELVVHADPPAEHKAYLHRSGRTARAGKAGTVITLATPDQRQEVRGLMRAAKIKPSVSGADRAVLDDLAPGDRTWLGADEAMALAQPTKVAEQQARPTTGEASGSQGGRGRGGRSRGGRGGAKAGENRAPAGRQENRSGKGPASSTGADTSGGGGRRRRGGRGQGGGAGQAAEGQRGSTARGSSGSRGGSGTGRASSDARATTVYSTSSGSSHSAADFSRSTGRRGRR